MNESEVDLRSLPLHDLLAAPLTAAMEAQQQASLSLVGLIRELGFETRDDQQPVVRMVEFRYIREGRDADGKPTKVHARLRIPLLTMISLPHLEIEHLNFNFLAGLQSVRLIEASPRIGIPPDLLKRYPFLRGHSNLRVTPTPRTTVKGNVQTARPYDLEISVTASSEASSDGVERIITALTGMIVEEAK